MKNVGINDKEWVMVLNSTLRTYPDRTLVVVKWMVESELRRRTVNKMIQGEI